MKNNQSSIEKHPAMIAFFDADHELTNLIERHANAQLAADAARSALAAAELDKGEVVTALAGGNATDATLATARKTVDTRARELNDAEEVVAASDALIAGKKRDLFALEKHAREVHHYAYHEFKEAKLQGALQSAKPAFYAAWHASQAYGSEVSFDAFVKRAFAALDTEEAVSFVPEDVKGFPYSKNLASADRRG